MPANEFEKQVKVQMDDFELNPSASVWKKVEEEITRKKRRRVIFFFILPAVLLLVGYSVYHFFYNTQITTTDQQQVAEKNEKSTTPANNNTPKNRTTQPVAPGIKESIKHYTTNEKQLNNNPATNKKDNQIDVSSNDLLVSHIAKKKSLNPEHKAVVLKNKPVSSLIKKDNVSAKEEITATGGEPVKIADNKDEEVKNTAVVQDPQKDKVVVHLIDESIAKTDSAEKKEVIEPENKNVLTQQKKILRKVKWGIDFSGGISSNRAGLFFLNNSYDALSSNAATGGGPTASVNPPSAIWAGLSFKIGITTELPVSKRSRVSAGLQYAFLSNKIKTGILQYTTAVPQSNNYYLMTRVYSGPQLSAYINRYHFISLPVYYHWQINKSKSLPVEWNAGISFNYLVGTNALVYSTSSGGVYYHDKDAFNKFHLNIGTGLSFRFKNKKGFEWTLGPAISFDTRKMLNTQYSSKQYLLFGGVNAKVFFPKKKSK